MFEAQLETLERATAPRPPAWSWLLVAVGLLAMVLLSAHAFSAYMGIDRINQDARLDTGNPVLLFQDLATNGPRISAAIPSSSRSTYTRALNQYVVDGAGVCLSLALAFAGLFIRLNR